MTSNSANSEGRPLLVITGLPNPAERPTITIEETAQILRISRASAYAAARAGEIPTIRFGRRLVVPTAALRRLLAVDGAAAA